jgi:hypothetical protein
MMSAVTWNLPGPRGPDVGFAERLLEVIDSGRRTATYKLALLIALLDLCARHSDAGGRAPAARRSCGRSRRQADRSRTGRTCRYIGDYLGKHDQG